MAGKSILLRDPNFSRILDNMLQKRLYHYKLCLQILIFSLLKTTQLNKTKIIVDNFCCCFQMISDFVQATCSKN